MKENKDLLYVKKKKFFVYINFFVCICVKKKKGGGGCFIMYIQEAVCTCTSKQGSKPHNKHSLTLCTVSLVSAPFLYFLQYKGTYASANQLIKKP